MRKTFLTEERLRLRAMWQCFPIYICNLRRPGVRACGWLIPFWACIHYPCSCIYFPSVLHEQKLQIFLVGHKAQGFPPPASSCKGYFYNSLWLWVILCLLGEMGESSLRFLSSLLSLNVSATIVTSSAGAAWREGKIIITVINSFLILVLTILGIPDPL